MYTIDSHKLSQSATTHNLFSIRSFGPFFPKTEQVVQSVPNHDGRNLGNSLFC